MDWRPLTLTDKATGRKVSITIFEAEMYKTGFFNFDDLWEMYKDDTFVQIMNGTYNAE